MPWRRVSMQRVLRRSCIGIMFSALVGIPASAQETKDLGTTSIEDLMNIEVSSVSKKEQKLSRVAAAVFVITQQDIRRSGATSLPDLLRMVPGLDVAQVNSSTWAISSRGFNDQVSNKLLVLIDGRTVYSPLFSGVFWDVQQLPLETIDHIEVIRGPGAAVWGANAVNGVINISTKKAEDVQGGELSVGAGTYDKGFGTVQYGGKLGRGASYRTFVNAFDRNHLVGTSRNDGEDEWHSYRTGFRVDSGIHDKNSITCQGDAYRGSEVEIVDSLTSLDSPQPRTVIQQQRFAGWDVLASWNRTFSKTSESTLEIYFDRTNRADTSAEGRSTAEIDFQHHIAWGTRHDFVWGLGYRHTSDDLRNTLRIALMPATASLQLFSSFLQDEMTLVRDRVYFTIGAKFEHNRYTGFGFQPDASIIWLINRQDMVWASISRSLRTPSRAEEDIRFNQGVFLGPNGLPILISLFGGGLKDETLLADQIGYRTQLSPRLSVDLTAFYNSYADLASHEVGSPFFEGQPAPAHLVLPIRISNQLEGETHGAEMGLNWKPLDRLTFSASNSYLQMHIRAAPGSTDASSQKLNGSSPREQAQFRVHAQLAAQWSLDTSLYFVGSLRALQIPSYERLDAGLTWKFGENAFFSVVGQNLLHDHHLESKGENQVVLSSLVKRSVYAKFNWRF